MKKMVILAVVLSISVLAGCGKEVSTKESESVIATSKEETTYVDMQAYNELVKEKKELEKKKEELDASLEKAWSDYKSMTIELTKKITHNEANDSLIREELLNDYAYLVDLEKWEDSEQVKSFALALGYYNNYYKTGSVESEISELGYKALYKLLRKDIEGYKKDLGSLYNLIEGDDKYTNDEYTEEMKYEAGQYKVGVDIPAGEYMFFAESKRGYFCVSSDANGKDIIQNNNFGYNSIMYINNGEYLNLSNAYAVPLESVSEIPVDQATMFKVGVHLPAGEYKLTATGSGYYCVYNDNRQDDIDTNENFNGQSYVSVVDGQYLELSRCSIQQ